MFFRLFLLFTLVPLLELAVLLRIGGLIGAWPTIGLVVATGVAGAWMARREGTRSWRAVQSELAAGRFPGEPLLHSLLVLMAGIVLVTPGVFTDLAGILLLVRPLRAALIGRLRSRFRAGLAAGSATPGVGLFHFHWSGGGGREREAGDTVRRPGGAPGSVDEWTRPERAPDDEETEAEAETDRRPRVIEL